MTKFISAAVIAVLFFTMGATFGFNKVLNEFYHLESIILGRIATDYAKKLDSPEEKELNDVRWYIEDKIDRGLDGYLWYREEGNTVFSKTFLKEHYKQYRDSAKVLAIYRKKYPEKDVSSEMGYFSKEYRINFDQRRQLVAELLGE